MSLKLFNMNPDLNTAPQCASLHVGIQMESIIINKSIICIYCFISNTAYECYLHIKTPVMFIFMSKYCIIFQCPF